ncbi:gag-pol polyprotein [Lasius niger]|uniref:Gag-pol polyprotein n=1 Tax=Lasius niger TaxID=67767 RepID=A0A0J7K5K6_LASNI|nr:gag-pol polyprotein [Lasius niger]
MKDLGEANHILGLRITRNRKDGKIWFDQSNYIGRIIQECGMEDCNPVSTPFDTSTKLSHDMEPKTKEDIDYMKNIPYREVVGKLQYASQGTRPDITFVVNSVSRYLANPGKEHWMATKRILRYLKGTQNMALEFNVIRMED